VASDYGLNRAVFPVAIADKPAARFARMLAREPPISTYVTVLGGGVLPDQI